VANHVLGSARFLRAAFVSSIIMSLSVGAHVVGGGALPVLPVLTAMGAFILLPVMVIARFRLSIPLVGILLGGGQFILHHGLTAFSSSADCSAESITGHFRHGASVAVRCAETSTALHSGSSGVVLPMILAHMVATFIAAWVIARGEQSFVRTLKWLRARLLRSVIPTAVPTWENPLVPRDHRVPSLTYRGRPECRRGPPALSYAR